MAINLAPKLQCLAFIEEKSNLPSIVFAVKVKAAKVKVLVQEKLLEQDFMVYGFPLLVKVQKDIHLPLILKHSSLEMI